MTTCDKCGGAHAETERYSDCVAFWREQAREAQDMLGQIYKVATGEIQVANDDTGGMAVIARWIFPPDHCHACQMETQNCRCAP